jgi:hypothetical protein
MLKTYSHFLTTAIEQFCGLNMSEQIRKCVFFTYATTPEFAQFTRVYNSYKIQLLRELRIHKRTHSRLRAV